MKHTGRPQPPFTSELYNRVPVMYPDNSPFTRSTFEPNELEKKNFSNENTACISQYPDANIHFRKVKVVIPWLPDASFETDARFVPDAKLEALDAKLEALYNTDVIMMELTLNEPEDYIRPDFDCEGELEEYLVYDDSGEMTPRGRIIKTVNKADVILTDDEDYDDDHYEEFSRSDRFNNYDDDDDLDNEECCEYCQMSKKIVLYNWRCEDGGLCEDCANLLTKNDEA
jgi:hypothetical protein